MSRGCADLAPSCLLSLTRLDDAVSTLRLEPSLADAGRPDDGHQPTSPTHGLAHAIDIDLAADEFVEVLWQAV